MSRPKTIVAIIIVVGIIGAIGTFAYRTLTTPKSDDQTTTPPDANPPAANPPTGNPPTVNPPVANPPAGAPPATQTPAPSSGVTVAPTPIPRAVDSIGDLIEDMHWYKENGKGDFLVSSQVPPFHIQVAASFFKEADQKIFTSAAEEEINRTNAGRTVTDLKFVRFTLDSTSSRFESALILFEGVDANGNALNAPNQTSAVRVVFDSNVWTMQRSIMVARQIRQALHDTLGLPDRGEVRQQPILINRDPLLNVTSSD